MTEQPTTLTVAQVADRGSAVLDEVATARRRHARAR